ncbi:hypothetical protein [Mycolicibacterium gilvum]|uniref:hypothetical protein n=1 Tax=Mycolicibacterium gilvum TaxID=1804 RepID=UPI0040457D2D
MTTTEHPVDSTTRPCCGGIGRHTRDCRPDVAPPPGANPDMWIDGVRDVWRQVGAVAVSRDPLKCPTVTVLAEQRRDGSLGCIDVTLDVAMGRSDTGMAAVQARQLARLLTEAADLAERWASR